VVDDGLDAGVEVDTGEQSVAEVVVDGVCLCVCVCVCVCSVYNRTPRSGRGPWTNNGTCHTYTDVKLSRPDWS